MSANRTVMQRQQRFGVCVSILLALTGVSAVQADDILQMGVNISPTPVFEASSTHPTPPSQWNVKGMSGLGADMTNGTAVNVGGSKIWWLAPACLGAPPGLLNWQADLETDLNPGGPVAHARFMPDGTMSLSGKVYDESQVEIFDGVMLTATVSAFEMKESDLPTSENVLKLEGIGIVRPREGFLLQNGMGMNLVGDYYLDVTISLAQQGGGDLIDFTSGDVASISSMQMQLLQVPEPGTATLAAGALLCCMFGRRRKPPAR